MFDLAEWGILLGHFEAAFLYGIVPTVVIALFVGLLAVVTKSWTLMKFAFFFGILGAGIGVMLGASREPAVKAFLPAILTLIGGFVAYAFPREEKTVQLLANDDTTPPLKLVRSFVITAIVSLMLSAVAGANFGGSVRGDYEGFLREDARNQLYFEKVQMQLELEQLRNAMGLPAPSK